MCDPSLLCSRHDVSLLDLHPMSGSFHHPRGVRSTLTVHWTLVVDHPLKVTLLGGIYSMFLLCPGPGADPNGCSHVFGAGMMLKSPPPPGLGGAPLQQVVGASSLFSSFKYQRVT